MTSKSLLESLNPKGHLEIIKRYTNGKTEVVLSDHNIITVGMGTTLASLFSADDATATFDNFALTYFQVGKGARSMVSGTTSLHTPASLAEYLDTDLTVSSHAISVGGSDQAFVHINPAHISKISDTKITYSLILDEATANDISLTEIGMFSKNPTLQDPSIAYLCAYRTFTAIAKNDSYSLILKWTIEF
jgi:hypothetical protein